MTIAATPGSGTEILGDGVRTSWIVAMVPGVSVSGFSMRDATGNGIVNASVTGSNLANAGGAAVFIDGAIAGGGTTVHDTHITYSGYGVRCIRCKDAPIIRNRMMYNRGAGVMVEFSDNVTISGTDFLENGWSDASLRGAAVAIADSINSDVHSNLAIWNHHGVTVSGGDASITVHDTMIAMGPTPGYARFGARGRDNGYYLYGGPNDGQDDGLVRYACDGVNYTTLAGFNGSPCEERGGYVGYAHVKYQTGPSQDQHGAARLPAVPTPR
jgi:hypothetical protein